MSSFMRDPVGVLLQRLEPREWERAWFDHGVIALALELVTRIKLLEDVAVTTERERQAIISALQTILTDLELAPGIYELYDELSRWRQPRFVPDAPFPEPSRRESDGAGDPSRLGLSGGTSSSDASPPG